MNFYLYAVTVGCPACEGVSQFVVTKEKEVGVMQDISVGKSHCPDCGVSINDVGGWDHRAEHLIDTATSVAETAASRRDL
jgi:C4-type Zn-finger protein